MSDAIDTTPDRFEISSGLLVRNSLLSIAGQALPLLIGLAAVPTIVHGLGPERFGLLVFTWTLTGAFSIFDLGLGSSVTKFVAEALGRGTRTAIPSIVWPAVAGQTAVGAIGACLAVLAAQPLVSRFLHVAPEMHDEAIRTLQITGLSLPILLLTVTLRGTLEAAQRFDITTGLKSVSIASVFLVPLGGVLAGWDLPRIVGGLVVARVLLLSVHIVACLRVFPLLARPTWGDRERLRPLFAFGGWITVSALAGLALGYADRFAIGHALSMTALTYYSVPQDLIGRLGLIAATLGSVLVPAFSTLGGAQDLSRLSLLFSRSAKLVALIMGPAFIILAIFSQNILTLWLGPALASESAPVLRVLALGAGFQVLTVIPTSMVQAVGRPDLVAKFYLVEAPLYLAAVWWLVHSKGIGGVALAWSGRFALDGLLMFWVTLRMGLWSWDSSTTRVVGALVGVCACTALVYVMPLTLWMRAGLAAGLMVAFYGIVWTSILRRDERQWIFQMASQWRGEPVSPQG